LFLLVHHSKKILIPVSNDSFSFPLSFLPIPPYPISTPSLHIRPAPRQLFENPRCIHFPPPAPGHLISRLVPHIQAKNFVISCRGYGRLLRIQIRDLPYFSCTHTLKILLDCKNTVYFTPLTVLPPGTCSNYENFFAILEHAFPPCV
jgi:hypothetical protein